MMARREALGPRADGRLYSRVTRRSVALLKHLRLGRRFDLIEIAREVHEAAYPEFFRTAGREVVPVRPDRIRDYLSHLHALGLIVQADRQFALEARFSRPSTDAEWAQYLSDVARGHLAAMMEVSPGDLPKSLEGYRKKLHSKQRVPTVAAVLAEIGLEGTRNAELFRWSLFLYTDGEACPLEIRQYPHLVPRA